MRTGIPRSLISSLTERSSPKAMPLQPYFLGFLLPFLVGIMARFFCFVCCCLRESLVDNCWSASGISGFETSANFVEEQAHGVFVKTLRNMWIAVAFFNPILSLLSLMVLPVDDIYVHQVPSNVLRGLGVVSLFGGTGRSIGTHGTSHRWRFSSNLGCHRRHCRPLRWVRGMRALCLARADQAVFSPPRLCFPFFLFSLSCRCGADQLCWGDGFGTPNGHGPVSASIPPQREFLSQNEPLDHFWVLPHCLVPVPDPCWKR